MRQKRFIAILLVLGIFILQTSYVAIGETDGVQTEATSEMEADPTEVTDQVETTDQAVEEGQTEAEKEELYDSIIQSLTGTISKEEAKKRLEAIKQKANLDGDVVLQSYAEYMEKALDLEQQLADVNGLIEGLKYTAPELATIDDSLQKSIVLSITLEDILQILPPEAKSLLEGLDLQSADGFDECFAELLELIEKETKGFEVSEEMLGEEATTTRLASISAENCNFIALQFLILAQNNQMIVEEEDFNVCIDGIVHQLKQQYNPYSTTELRKLKQGSDQFQDCGKYAETMEANQLIMIGKGFKLKQAPIMYKGQILISMEDIEAYFDGERSEFKDSNTTVVQAGTLLIEVQKGESVGYVNDCTCILNVPVLSFQGRTYVSAELLAEASGASYLSLPKQQCSIIHE